MRTNLWDQFDGLISAPQRLLATVTAHNADGTSSLTTYDGAEMRALGVLGATIPYNVWVRARRVIEAAPNLELIELTV